MMQVCPVMVAAPDADVRAARHVMRSRDECSRRDAAEKVAACCTMVRVEKKAQMAQDRCLPVQRTGERYAIPPPCK